MIQFSHENSVSFDKFLFLNISQIFSYILVFRHLFTLCSKLNNSPCPHLKQRQKIFVEITANYVNHYRLLWIWLSIYLSILQIFSHFFLSVCLHFLFFCQYSYFFSFLSAPSLIPLASEYPGSHSSGTNRVADLGPGDTGHEMHAKMEEAIEHALAIINGAAKFADEAQLEQVVRIFSE